MFCLKFDIKIAAEFYFVTLVCHSGRFLSSFRIFMRCEWTLVAHITHCLIESIDKVHDIFTIEEYLMTLEHRTLTFSAFLHALAFRHRNVILITTITFHVNVIHTFAGFDAAAEERFVFGVLTPSFIFCHRRYFFYSTANLVIIFELPKFWHHFSYIGT